MKFERPDWDEYFLRIAEVVSTRGTCLRRRYGAVIVKDFVVVSTGYNGAPRGEVNCTTLGVCQRKDLNIPSGERYELCRSVHAEMNAIINGDPQRMIGATIYIAGADAESWASVPGDPCLLCSRQIKNARILRIVTRDRRGIPLSRLVSEYFPGKKE